MRSLLFLLFSIINFNIFSQELNCQVIINSDLVDQTNQKIFKTLEVSLNEFVNSNSWTNTDFLSNEKITCSFVLNLTNYNADLFEGTLQILSQRPIFMSDYDSPIINFLDKEIKFKYEEYQPLFYNSEGFESNLTSIFSFYIYLILGLDADTYSLFGGQTYIEQAQKIVNLSQQGGKGWNQNESNRNRFWLIDAIRSNSYKEYRETLYNYHRKGMDFLTDDPLNAKKEILFSFTALEKLYVRRPNALPLQIFFDAKSQEIVDIFSSGPKVDFENTFILLNKVAPFFAPKWKQINY
jgi:hypothetical protein